MSSDQEALTVHQVKAHDVMAFAASKGFQSGVSLEQLLSACHWKFHNTFTQFYLMGVAWANLEHCGGFPADPPLAHIFKQPVTLPSSLQGGRSCLEATNSIPLPSAERLSLGLNSYLSSPISQEV